MLHPFTPFIACPPAFPCLGLCPCPTAHQHPHPANKHAGDETCARVGLQGLARFAQIRPWERTHAAPCTACQGRMSDRRIHQPCASGCSCMARQRACAGRKEQRRRVILSLRLSRLVEGLTSSALVQGVALPACVTSLEDHGYLLSFGIQVSLCASCVDTRQGKARQGKARQGKARQGKAKARQGKRITSMQPGWLSSRQTLIRVNRLPNQHACVKSRQPATETCIKSRQPATETCTV